MVNIAICDDEIDVVNKTKRLIQEYNKYKINIHTYNKGEELLKSNISFDIIFLDIDMNGINGIETAKKIREYDKKVKIIYVTNYTDYTYSAFGVHAFAYIIKPIDKEKLYKQLDEVFSYLEEESEDTIEVITCEGIVRTNLKEICYFEYQSRKVIMKTLNKSYIINKKISEVSNNMEIYGFEIPHKSFCVNLYNVKSVKGYDIHMMDGSVIPLSQKKSSVFREKLNVYISKQMEKQRRGM